MPGLYLTVEFDDVGASAADLYHRSITLSGPTWSAPIGRATSTLQGQQESGDNAIFSSRVISREHARIKADPETRGLTIEDVGSMHGTHVGGTRLLPYQPEILYNGDTVTFGAEVERLDYGSTHKFKPVRVRVYYTWSDAGHNNDEPAFAVPASQTRNSFCADYSEDEPATPYGSEGEEEAEPRSPGVLEAPHTFAVPSSDLSEGSIISIASDDDGSDVESPTSSPIGSLDLAEKKYSGQHKVETHKAASMSSPRCSPTSPGYLPKQQEPIDLESDYGSYYEGDSIFEGSDGDSDDDFPKVVQEQESPIRMHSKPSAGIQVARAREPSPSDAAMAKPPLVAPMSPPFSQRLPSINEMKVPDSVVGPANPSLSDSSRNQSAWAGYNSVLYEPMPISNPYATANYFGDMPVMTPANYKPATAATNPNNSDLTSCCAVPELVFTEDVIKAVPELVVRSLSETVGEGVDQFEEPVRNMPATSGANNAEVARKIKSSRKRKANEITADELSLSAKSLGESSLPNAQRTKADVLVEVLPDSLNTIIADSIKSPSPPANMAVEPLKKKIKKTKEGSSARSDKQGSTFAKFAATAVVSAAVGAVTMVFGLAALPADYFV